MRVLDHSLACTSYIRHNPRPVLLAQNVMVASTGPFAMIDGKLRQARKGATVAVDSCAGVWLVGVHHQIFCLFWLVVISRVFLKTFLKETAQRSPQSIRFRPVTVYTSARTTLCLARSCRGGRMPPGNQLLSYQSSRRIVLGKSAFNFQFG